MSNPNFIVHDSEDESDGGALDEPLQDQQLQPAPILSESTNPASTAEIRRKEIDEAHAALLSTGTIASPTPADPPSEKSKAKRSQTTNGRLEKDIYAFSASEEGEDIHPSKRQRLSPEERKSKTTFNRDDYEAYSSDHNDGKKKKPSSSKKKPAKRAKSTGGMSVIDLLNDSDEGFDLRLSMAKTPTSGRKSTRNNTHEWDLLPPLPKPKRKLKESSKVDTAVTTDQSFDGNLTLNFNRSTERQVAGTGESAPPTPHNFMVDLSKDHLVLPEELRAEYDPVPLGYSPTELPEDSPGNSGAHDSSDLLSTIPDPPYDPSLLPSQIRLEQLDPPSGAPLAATTLHSNSALSPPHSSSHKKPPAKKAGKDKKRAVTDQNLEPTADNDPGVFPIASEWRAAKGKARQGMSQAAPRRKTMNDLNAESDDDGTWVGEVKNTKKKKPVAKKRKSAVAEEDRGVEVQKHKAKRSKSKPVETVTISDSEDELEGSPAVRRSATIQASCTSSPMDRAGIKVDTKMNTTINPGDEPLGSIAVSNSLPSVDPGEDQPAPKPKKVHKWQVLKDKRNTATGSEERGAPPFISIMNMNDAPLAPPIPPLAPAPAVVESKRDPGPKRQTPAQRRKSRKADSEEEGWDGGAEPKKRQKNEVKAKATRMTKKAAVTEGKVQLPNQMVKDFDDDDDGEGDEGLTLVEPVKKAPAKKEPKLSKIAAAKAKGEKEKIEAEAEEIASEKENEKKATPPPPPPKSGPQPQTPSNLAEKGKSKTSHSPINKGPVGFRVGLSRRAHIEPLLKIIRK